MSFSSYKAKWTRSRLSKETKKQRWDEIQQIILLIDEKKFHQAKFQCQKIHDKAQFSCIIHPISHILLAKIAFKMGNNRSFCEQCWLSIWAPLASFSRRLGADPRRRFFGLGPIRFSEQNHS